MVKDEYVLSVHCALCTYVCTCVCVRVLSSRVSLELLCSGSTLTWSHTSIVWEMSCASIIGWNGLLSELANWEATYESSLLSSTRTEKL